ncbi:MAG: hypothetical protein PVI23_07035 [Maricaulaceae bacterium]|jgi:hypothetical protein
MSFDLQLAETCQAIRAKIGDTTDRLAELTDAEVKTLMAGVSQSLRVVAAEACRQVDPEHLRTLITEAYTDAQRDGGARLVKRAMRGGERLANGKVPSAAQWAAMIIEARAEEANVEAEIERRGATLQ